MKAIFAIFIKDVKAIASNYAAIIVVVALMVLPSLYAWFNIKASWDPYSKKSTSGIRIGVVNQDVGTTLKGKEINLGDQVIDELKNNDQMGWQFVTEKEAMKALREERYYAVITIPKDFSLNLTSIISSDIKKGTILYTVNEKMNAVAPKLTDKGVSSLQATISETVVGTVSNTIFRVANELGVDLEEQIPNITKAYDSLTALQGKFSEINATITKADEGVGRLDKLLTGVEEDLPKITDTISSANAFAGELQTYIKTAKQTTAELSPMISQNLSLFSAMADDLNGKLEALNQAIAANAENVPELVSQVRQQAASLGSMVGSLSGLLDRINKFAPNETIAGYIDTLTKGQSYLAKIEGLAGTLVGKIENGTYSPGEYVEELVKVSNQAATTFTKLKDVESKLAPALNQVFTDAYNIAGKAKDVLTSAEAKLPEVNSLLKLAFTGVDKGKEGITEVKKVVPKAETLINEFVGKLKQVKDEANLNELVELLKSDVTKRSDFLANPVTVKEERIYPIANYGTGMSPFYTVLSLWVGILLLVSMLSVEAKGEYRPFQVYFGKMLLFGSITIVQALVVSLGDLYLLGITCKHPAVFVVGSVLTSIAFTIIVYSLVSVFGNVGKVIAIILLVLQVAGSGGTFPVQLTPRFFQIINPFLPFTYCISFAREAIGGIVKQIVVRDLIFIGMFVFGFLAVSLLLKGPINKCLHQFTIRFKESGVGAD